jgi:hypothetical protein
MSDAEAQEEEVAMKEIENGEEDMEDEEEEEEKSEGGDELDTVDYGAMFKASYEEDGTEGSASVAMLAHFVQTFGHVMKLEELEFGDIEASFGAARDETQELLLRTLLRLGDKRARLNEWQDRVRRLVRNEVARHRGRFDLFGPLLESETQLFLTKKRFQFMDTSRSFKFAVIPLLLAQACNADAIVNAADALSPDDLREHPIVYDANARLQWYSFDRPEQRATGRIYRESFSFDSRGRGKTDDWTSLCSNAEQMRDLRASLAEKTNASKSERQLLQVIDNDLIAPTEAIEREMMLKERARERKQKRLERLGHATTFAMLFDETKRRRLPPGAYALDIDEPRRSSRHGGHSRGTWADEPAPAERSTSNMSRGERAARREQQVVMQRTLSDMAEIAEIGETDDAAENGESAVAAAQEDEAQDVAPPRQKKRVRREVVDDDDDSWGGGGADERFENGTNNRHDDEDADFDDDAEEEAAEQRRAAQERLARPVKARLEPVATVAFSPGGHAADDDDDEEGDGDDAWKAATGAMKKSGGVSFD